MAVCEICSKPIRRGDEQYIQIPDTGVSHCVCAGCRACMTTLTGETDNMNLFDTCVKQMSAHLENGDINDDLKAYIRQVLSTVDEKKESAERRRMEHTEAWQKKAAEEKAEKVRRFKTTTGYQFDGYRVMDYKKVVSGEIVLGGGVFKEIAASASDVFGVRAGGFEANLENAKNAALDKAIDNALNVDANALLGIDFDITTIGNSMMVVSVSGTAVIIEKQEE